MEDNADTRKSVMQLLQSERFDVRTAGSVGEATEAMARERFNLLISDIGLPDGSGLDVMRLGRDRYGLRGIAFSGYGSREDVAESMAAGFTHHVAKPSNFKALVDLVRMTAS